MSKPKRYLALDVGDARIGVAQGEPTVRIAVPHETVERDGSEVKRIAELVLAGDISHIIIGYPRNQSGEATQQTASVEAFAKQLIDIPAKIVFQDESLTSVLAEQQLQAAGTSYTRGDIDMVAASLILQDYLEASS